MRDTVKKCIIEEISSEASHMNTSETYDDLCFVEDFLEFTHGDEEAINKEHAPEQDNKVVATKSPVSERKVAVSKVEGSQQGKSNAESLNKSMMLELTDVENKAGGSQQAQPPMNEGTGVCSSGIGAETAESKDEMSHNDLPEDETRHKMEVFSTEMQDDIREMESGVAEDKANGISIDSQNTSKAVESILECASESACTDKADRDESPLGEIVANKDLNTVVVNDEIVWKQLNLARIPCTPRTDGHYIKDHKVSEKTFRVYVDDLRGPVKVKNSDLMLTPPIDKLLSRSGLGISELEDEGRRNTLSGHISQTNSPKERGPDGCSFSPVPREKKLDLYNSLGPRTKEEKSKHRSLSVLGFEDKKSSSCSFSVQSNPSRSMLNVDKESMIPIVSKNSMSVTPNSFERHGMCNAQLHSTKLSSSKDTSETYLRSNEKVFLKGSPSHLGTRGSRDLVHISQNIKPVNELVRPKIRRFLPKNFEYSYVPPNIQINKVHVKDNVDWVSTSVKKPITPPDEVKCLHKIQETFLESNNGLELSEQKGQDAVNIIKEAQKRAQRPVADKPLRRFIKNTNKGEMLIEEVIKLTDYENRNLVGKIYKKGRNGRWQLNWFILKENFLTCFNGKKYRIEENGYPNDRDGDYVFPNGTEFLRKKYTLDLLNSRFYLYKSPGFFTKVLRCYKQPEYREDMIDITDSTITNVINTDGRYEVMIKRNDQNLSVRMECLKFGIEHAGTMYLYKLDSIEPFLRWFVAFAFRRGRVHCVIG